MELRWELSQFDGALDILQDGDKEAVLLGVAGWHIRSQIIKPNPENTIFCLDVYFWA